ncbi:unnamed protein product [Leuciscus chuanchicus]
MHLYLGYLELVKLVSAGEQVNVENLPGCLFMQRSRSLTAKRLHSEPIAYGDSEDSPGILPRLPFLEADGGISFSLRYKKSYPASARVIHRRRRKEGS